VTDVTHVDGHFQISSLPKRHDCGGGIEFRGRCTRAELELEDQRGGQQHADHGYERKWSNDEQQ
jgi:hypothetical protein